MSGLEVEVGGVRLRNPFLLASGIWGESGRSLARIHEAGAGGVVTKSIGRNPRDGYPNPTVESLGDWGMLNAMGLPNPGIERYPEEIREALSAGATVIGSVFGGDAEEFAQLAGQMADTGVCAVELNLSCPHARGYGSEIGQDPEVLREVVRAVRQAIRIPVWAKLTPNTQDPAALARAAERAGAHAISAINTVRAMAIDTTLRRPVLANGFGGLSGPAIKPIGLACIWQMYDAVKIPLVGIGGIQTARDALEYLLAGARAVEIGTAVATRGPGVFAELCRDLPGELERAGCADVASAVGGAHPRGDPPAARAGS